MNWMIFLIIVSIASACSPFPDPSRFQSGDILLQDLRGSFGESVENTSKSSFSHVGLVRVDENKRVFVLEATTPFVKESSLSDYLRRTRSRYALVRVSNLSDQQKATAVKRAKTHLGKPYDRLFVLDDVSSLYCSELIYDAYLNGPLLSLFPIKPMDFSGNLEFWEKWFGSHPIPQGKPGLSPQDTYDFPRSEVILEAQCKHPRQALFHTLYTN